MSEQQTLPGFGASSEKPQKLRRKMLPFRLFFALFPAADRAAAIAALSQQLRDQYRLSGNLQAAHRLHVTLHDLDEHEVVPDELVATAMRAAATISAESFDVTFDQAMSFNRSGVYVLCGKPGTQAVIHFRQQLGKVIGSYGIPWSKSYTPHMTLNYTYSEIAPHAIEPVRWHASEFVLVKSHVGKSVHEILGRWPLSAKAR